MKIVVKILSLLVLLFVAFAAHAQNPVRCATTEKFKEALAKNPAIALQREALEQFTQEQILRANSTTDTSIYTIPVIVHVVYHSFDAAAQNISDSQIQSQMDAINEDFARLNADTSTTPLAFQSVAVDTKIRFQLTNKDPNGNPSSGIERISTAKNNVGSDDSLYSIAPAWDRTCYYNVWVCNIDGGNTLGFSYLPGTVVADHDGTVVDYKAFGRIGTLFPSFNKGRTFTHEAGHFLNLLHTWGDSPSCIPDDDVSDTPLESDASTGCPTFPLTDVCTTSAPGVMFMNYMNYVDDNCMNLFTAGQRDRMRAALYLAPRDKLRDRSLCNVLSIQETKPKALRIYPNPVEKIVFITIPADFKVQQIAIYNILGQVVMQSINSTQNDTLLNLDISSLSRGMYFLRIVSNQQELQERFIKN